MIDPSHRAIRAQAPLSRAEKLAFDLEHVVREAFGKAGWELCSLDNSSNTAFTCSVRKGAIRYALVLNTAADARKDMLQALLADAALRAAAAAKLAGGAPLALVGAPVLSTRQRGALHQYARSFLGETAYGLVDQTRRVE